MSVIYLDTSAIAKLVVPEPRAVRRAMPTAADRVRSVLQSFDPVQVTTSSWSQAGRLAPVAMRKLDALHHAQRATSETT